MREWFTNLPGVGVGEVIHEKVNSPEAEILVTRREGPLELRIIDEATAVSISQLKACHHAGIRARRECGWDQPGEWVCMRSLSRVHSGHVLSALF